MTTECSSRKLYYTFIVPVLGLSEIVICLLVWWNSSHSWIYFLTMLLGYFAGAFWWMSRTMLLDTNQNTTVSSIPPGVSNLILCPFVVIWIGCWNCTWLLICMYGVLGHLMEKIESENLLHRAFSVFLFNSKYELLLQVWKFSFHSALVRYILQFCRSIFVLHLAKVFNFHFWIWYVRNGNSWGPMLLW